MGSQAKLLCGWALLFGALIFLANGCAHPRAVSRPGLSTEREASAFGRIRMIENGKAVAWGIWFDRPTPELLHVESGRLLNRMDLSGEVFAEAFARDGTFCWELPPGTYRVIRIVPWQTDGGSPRDDSRKNIFPGVAFRIPEGVNAVYLGTLEISLSSRKDVLGNRWMTAQPIIRVRDELEQEVGVDCFTANAQKHLMSGDP